MKKICRRCRVEQDSVLFLKDTRTKDNLSIYCRECKRIEKRAWAAKNRDKIREYDKKNIERKRAANAKYMQTDRERNPEYYKSPEFKLMQRGWSLKKKFGLTNEAYDKKLLSQQGTCRICGIHQSETKRAFVVDHDHNTNTIRSILCGKCNSGIAFFCENIKILERAILYLKEWEEVST